MREGLCCQSRVQALTDECMHAPGQAFSAWIHICAIRLFVESILRYGLPPQFLAVLLKPNPKNAAKLRKLLGSVFGSSGTAGDSLLMLLTVTSCLHASCVVHDMAGHACRCGAVL
jgi:hypothetical protein